MNYIKRFSLFCFVVQCVTAVPRIDPLVETDLGFIRGLTSDDGTYSMFLGIPYAYVNQSNPFGPATPNTGFQSTFNAYDDSAVCPQYVTMTRNIITETLDCLHLNVFVPQTANIRSPLPVLVWIHGGAFRAGLAGRLYYDPNYIVQQNIIVVSINYRLGPYGFMCLNTPEVPGNQGLKDQQIALKWIKDNISAFGGNANEITISGESAGAASVDFHLLYNQERPFNKVILQSGNTQMPWAVLNPDTDAPFKLSEQLGFQTKDLNESLNYLNTVDPHLLIAAAIELDITFFPCIEQYFENVHQFVTEHPMSKNIEALRNIPVLIGVTSSEAVWQYDMFSSNLNNNPNNFIHELIQTTLRDEFEFTNDEESAAMVKVIRNLYIGDENYNEESMWTFIDYYSDYYFNHPTERCIEKYLAFGARNVYQYMFSYVGDRNIQYISHGLNNSDGGVGAGHADDVWYLFDMDILDDHNAQDRLTIDRMTTLWANFVKYGNPTPDTSDLIPVSWPPVTHDTMPYLDINNDLTVSSRFFHERMAFWDLFYKLHNNAIIGYNPENN